MRSDARSGLHSQDVPESMKKLDVAELERVYATAAATAAVAASA